MVYRFRAECVPDVVRLLNILRNDVVELHMLQVNPVFSADVIVTLTIDLHLTDVRTAMRKVVDSHVMVETLALAVDYTGERVR